MVAWDQILLEILLRFLDNFQYLESSLSTGYKSLAKLGKASTIQDGRPDVLGLPYGSIRCSSSSASRILAQTRESCV